MTPRPSRRTDLNSGASAPSTLQRATWIHLALILVLTAVAYLPSLDNEFTNWDDPQYVYDNPVVLHPSLGAILTTPVGANYHPLTVLSLAANYKISGTDPRSYHIVNLLLHLANTALVFAFVWMLTGGRRWATVVTALLFGLHPTHVESVAWISGRKDVLYAFFYLAGLITYLRYIDTNRMGWWIATNIAFVASLASKPAAVVFPITLLLVDAFRKRPWSARLIVEKSSWFILSIVAGLLTIRAQTQGGALASHWEPFSRLLAALYGLTMYVVKLIAPFHLSALHPPPWAEGHSPGVAAYAAIGAALVGVPLLIVAARRHLPTRFGLAFFFINIVLVLQFVAVGEAAMADRYTYLPYIGLIFALAWFLDNEPTASRFGPSARRVLVAFFALLVPICMATTWARCEVWRNSETLWTDVIRKSPDRAVNAYINRGSYYHRTVGDYRKALSDYDKAIAIDPAAEEAWNDRGVLFWEGGRRDSALTSFDRAIALRPTYEQAWNNRGGVKLETGDLAGAIADVSKAIDLNPRFSKAYANRAVALGLIGQHERAIADGGRAIELAPGNPENHIVYGVMGTASLALGRYRDAVGYLSEALRLGPVDDARRGGLFLARSRAWAGLGDKARALEDAREAIRLDPAIRSAYQRATGAGGP